MAAGLPSRLDPERGFDHGAFTPLKVMYPDANVPVVQLSLQRGLDPERHLALGRAIAPLRDDDVLIVGSGLSYHNLREFFSPRGWGPSREFDGWLNGVLLGGDPIRRTNYWPAGRLLLRHARPIRAKNICCRSWWPSAPPVTTRPNCHITRTTSWADSR